MYIRLGKECGLDGKELLAFADSALKDRRSEEDLAREERRLKREDDQKRLGELTKQKELDLKISECKRDSGITAGGFQSKIPCMPAFRAGTDELNAYIERFERHATLSKWPQNCWAAALGNLLTGPALDVYASISVQDASDFDLLKRMLLQHFSLTSEGNWKRFREAKKGRDESYYQFTARLTGYVKRSIELSGNDKTFDALLDMLVREHIYEISDRSLSTSLSTEQYRIAHSCRRRTMVVMCGVRIGRNEKRQLRKLLGRATNRHVMLAVRRDISRGSALTAEVATRSPQIEVFQTGGNLP